MDSLERCRIILGLSADNEAKLALLQVLLDKARLDIEAFCRDTFIEEGKDVFPSQLRSVQEDLAIQRFRKRGAEGQNSYSFLCMEERGKKSIKECLCAREIL